MHQTLETVDEVELSMSLLLYDYPAIFTREALKCHGKRIEDNSLQDAKETWSLDKEKVF